ncbi:O-antigen ligase [Glaciecola sp. 33A]|jgi:hypothetical protein|uniref:O-antigen ligase family protein n=1 Tax=Glaciecola sp. 33A TaxID=2057807 RepID=UPI000C31BD50|nr:O-antigen ligase family protein [Glaciecola sp. 33A]PKI01721.1 hypothetical protein CXF81_09835 [Glaciecola sp. 33A]
MIFEFTKVLLTIISFFILVKGIKNSPNKYVQFLLIAFWLRFFLGAFHQFTYVPIIGPFSLTAFFSILVATTGLLLIPKRTLLLKQLMLFYVFFVTIFLSAIYNGLWAGFIIVLIKWLYFLVITCCLYLGINKHGITATFKPLLIAFFLPISLQIASVLLSARKVTDNEGLAFSYIGGYFHESAFSMILVTFLVVLSLLKKQDVRSQTLLFLLGTIGIFLTNYRTAIIAALPVLLIFFFSKAESKIEQKYRPYFILIFGFSSFLLLSLFFTFNQERFADIGAVLGSIENLIKAPIYYTEIEKDLFSARIYIWSQYLSAFFEADIWTHIFGFGPESYRGVFEKYAHNTFVSFLYEYGYLGFSIFVFFNILLLKNAFLLKDKEISSRIFYSLIGFLILNLATMPLWALEGMIIYAMLISVIFSKKIVERV